MNYRPLLLVPFVLIMAACTGSAPADDATQEDLDNALKDTPIAIGYIGPLTGDAASYGADTVSGVKLAVDELNASGGINGRPIRLIAEDGRCNPADATGAAQKLINIDRVVAIIGGQCSGETLAAAPFAEAAKVVMISPISSSPDVTNAGDYIFRDYPSDALKTKAMSAYLKENGLSKIAIISENTDFAVAFRDALKENMGGDAFVMDELVEPNTKDYRTLISRLKNEEFDVFFPNGQTPASIAAMLQQFKEQGLDALMISHDVAQDVSTIEIAGEASEGMETIGVPQLEAGSSFSIKYLERYNATQGNLMFVALAYDAMRVLAEGLKEVGTENPEGLRDYLYNLESFEGTVADFSFDENGDVLGIPYKLYRVIDGAWTPIEDVVVE